MAKYLLDRLLCLFVGLAMESCMMFLYQPLLVVILSVCQAGEEHNRITCLFGLHQRYILLASPFSSRGMRVVDILVIERLAVEQDIMEAVFSLHQRPKGCPPVVNIGIVPGYNGYVRPGYTRYKIAVSLFPILDIGYCRLRYLARGIVHKRRHHHFFMRLGEMLCRKDLKLLISS